MYTGISGTANNEDIPWVASGGVSAQLATVYGELWLTVITGCAPISGPATITGTTLTVGDITIGASGCTDNTGEQQQWVFDFVKRPIEQTFSNGTLTWNLESGASRPALTDYALFFYASWGKSFGRSEGNGFK
jgi:hypothetical protein